MTLKIVLKRYGIIKKELYQHQYYGIGRINNYKQTILKKVKNKINKYEKKKEKIGEYWHLTNLRKNY